jgi:hypothetical protein
MSLVRRQLRSASASCAGLQSRQFPSHVSDAGADKGLVADELEGKAHQDRRESRQPRPLCRLPDGRGRHPSEFVRRHSAAHRGIAAAVHIVSVRRSSIMRSLKGEVRLDGGKFHNFRLSAECRLFPKSSTVCRNGFGLSETSERGRLSVRPASIWRMSANVGMQNIQETKWLERHQSYRLSG